MSIEPRKDADASESESSLQFIEGHCNNPLCKDKKLTKEEIDQQGRHKNCGGRITQWLHTTTEIIVTELPIQ